MNYGRASSLQNCAPVIPKGFVLGDAVQSGVTLERRPVKHKQKVVVVVGTLLKLYPIRRYQDTKPVEMCRGASNYRIDLSH